MVSFLSNRQWTIAALVVVLMLLMGLSPSPHPALAQESDWPTIALDPTEGPPGTAVTVTGSGWIPGETLDFMFAVNLEADGSYSEDTDFYHDIGQAIVGDDGSFTTTVIIPAEARDIGVQKVIAGGSGATWKTDAVFHVVTEPEEEPSPPLNPQVTALRFYESGYGDLPPDQRVYAQRFASDTSRYINWALDLEHPAPGRPVDLKITAIYLRDNGTGSWEEFWRGTWDTSVEGDWTESSHWGGYGFDDPGNWPIGSYRVDIYFEGLNIDGQLIASEQFEIYGEGETDLTANAGPDQTVSGSSPVAVQFDGSGSTGDIVRYQWYNQWGLLRAEGATPVIEVNFGYNDPQPGTQRTFTLVVEDSQGNTAQDEVTITLGETEEETPPPEGEGGTDLVANAGTDQTVPGPSPVAVQFDGSGSTGDIVRYQWYNQYGLLRAEGATPVIEVNFGYNDPQPGTKRTFTLVVEDSQGNTTQDQVTITLGETSKPTPTPTPTPEPPTPPVPKPVPTPTPPPNRPPVITLVGPDPLPVTQGCPFIDPKATATDAEDGDLGELAGYGSVNINTPGEYRLTYSVKDSKGRLTEKTRKVKVSKAIGTPICLSATPEGKAPNLVVFVHGCCTDAHGVYSLRKEFGDAIKQAFSQYPPSEPWEIVVWDWHEQTPKHNYVLEPNKISDDANEAYEAAAGDDAHEGEGNKLAKAINQYSIYKHIHLIAHSAGSKLINEAAKSLSKLNEKNAERPFIHLTFLDAYTPDNKDIEGDASYGYLSDYPNHYAEHYVDSTNSSLPMVKDLVKKTNAILPHAFNFDITDWIGANKGDPLLFGHWWPVYWYIQSMTGPYFYVCGSNSDLLRPCYGYPLSFEGVLMNSMNWTKCIVLENNVL
jgi:hypothetical protein